MTDATKAAGTSAATTCIRNLDWLVVWDSDAKTHRYQRGADLAFTGNTIIHAGGSYSGAADAEIDGRGRMAMPGLVNVHSHPMSEPMNKGFTDDIGSPRLGMSGLYEFMPIFRPDQAGTAACAALAYGELLRSGVTTLVDLSVSWPGWLDLFEKSGLRGVIAPMFRSARWFTPNGYTVEYEWDEAGGERGLEEALSLIDRARQMPSGRLDGMVSPSQIDTCTPALLASAAAAAKERKTPFQIHAAQSQVEFQEMTRRHGKTPLDWLDDIGILGAGTIIAHAIFADSHSWIRWHSDDDIARLRDTGTAVAHCPTVFVRRGILLESFARYRRAGIQVGIGTDTFPHNMLEEMRAVATLSRVAEKSVVAVDTGEVFNAATVGGAALLGRDDIGRLSAGAKADIVLVDTEHVAMRPVRDPLRSLIFSAAERAVRDVFVDGQQVVAEGRLLTLDLETAAAEVEAAQRRAEEQVPKLDYAGRSHQQVAPYMFPVD